MSVVASREYDREVLMVQLERANQIRSRRARLKRDLMAGARTVEGVLADPPEWVRTMRVFDLLLAQHRFGRVKVGRVLKLAGVSSGRTVGDLTERQVRELAAVMGAGG